MNSAKPLYLHEEVLLLALRDDKGTIEPGTLYQYAIGGAVLAELLLEDRIRLEERRRKHLVHAHGLSHVGDDLMDECLHMIREARRPADAQTWVSKFAGISRLKHRIATTLARKSVLGVDEDRILGLFSRTVYPEIDPEPERRIRDRLREAVLSDADNVDHRTVVLLSLANGSGLLKLVLDRKERKNRKKRIEQLSNGDVAGDVTREAIAAMQAAVMVATIVPTIVATSASN